MNKNHKHFKLEDSDLSHIFQSPGKPAIFIAVFVTLILCTIVLIQADWKCGKNTTEILKQQSEGQKQVALTENYQTEIKIILNDFLSSRVKEEFKIPENYQALVNQTLEKILNLIVPADYKEFHLELVILLDKEIQNIEDEGLGEELEGGWNELLDSYTWLSK